MITKKGINASPGVAIGPALVLDTEEYRIPRRAIAPDQVPNQIRILEHALDASRQEVGELRVAAVRKLGDKTASIFSFHEEIIADPKFRQAVISLIEKNRFTAAYALGQEMSNRTRMFRAVNDPYLKERVKDLYDIEKRIMRHILGREREDITRLTEPVILIAHDMTPSQAVTLDRSHILGFAVNVGGSTSHTAIIARQMGIPAVVALNDVTSDVAGGETIVIDGSHGIVVVNPDTSTLERYRSQQQSYVRLGERLAGLRDVPAVTRDGVAIALQANVELPEEATTAFEHGAEGIGLFRTEFVFLSAGRIPSESAQYETYKHVVEAANGRPVVIRTIDIGADKFMDEFGPQHDHNPVLGLRSVRYCLQHLDMFKIHLRAILRASAHGDARIMFPMITTLMELRQAKATLYDVMEDLEEDGIPFRRGLPIGIMVETPAAAMQAAALAKELDFMSIGTNDLTQYTLAVDRANERVSHLYSPHNPAVLRLIRDVVRAARRTDVSVNLCGEMGGKPIYCQLLLGLGLRQLSMAPSDIPEVKRIIRATTIKRCEAIARRVLRFDADRQVLNYLRDELRRLMNDDEDFSG